MTEIELNEKLKEIERERCNALPCQPNRRTGKAYRRQMHIKKNDDLLRIVIRHYVPHAGYVDWDFDGQTLLHSGKWIKRETSQKFRHQLDLPHKGNAYRRLFDYWWTLY